MLLLLAAGGGLRAQTIVHAPGGTLNGVVRDSATGAPVGYALIVVVGQEQRAFASESGNFRLTGLGSGGMTLRVQQIGYRAVALSLTVETTASAGGGPGLVVRLARRPVVLPEIVVHGDVCTGTEALGVNPVAESILDEAFKNAERILTMERSYPYQGTFLETLRFLDAAQLETFRRMDTIRFDTRRQTGYRRGSVLQGRYRGQVATYFSASDLAREEFRTSHCFWFAGRDTSVTDFPGHRIEFAPVAGTKSADWAGSLVIDSATMMLIRSEAHLVNLNRKQTTLTAARCVVLYREIVPTLALEMEADCRTESAGAPNTASRWRLIDFKFVGKSPVAPTPP